MALNEGVYAVEPTDVEEMPHRCARPCRRPCVLNTRLCWWFRPRSSSYQLIAVLWSSNGLDAGPKESGSPPLVIASSSVAPWMGSGGQKLSVRRALVVVG